MAQARLNPLLAWSTEFYDLQNNGILIDKDGVERQYIVFFPLTMPLANNNKRTTSTSNAIVPR